MQVLVPLMDVLAVATAFRRDASPLFGLVFLGFFCGFFLLLIAIHVAILYYVYTCVQRIPPQFRQIEPGMVFLLIIPFFNIVWNFFVYPKIADSFKAYFNSVGRADVGDCGKTLALVYCILVCFCIIPYLNLCIGIAVLVIFIILLVKFGTYKGQILPSTSSITRATPRV